MALELPLALLCFGYIAILALACSAALAVITGYDLGGRITLVGLPIVMPLFLSSEQPERFNGK